MVSTGWQCLPAAPHALRVAAAVPGRQPALPGAKQAVGPGHIPRKVSAGPREAPELYPFGVQCWGGFATACGKQYK